MKLAPIADRAATRLFAKGADVNDSHLEETIYDSIYFEADELSFFATNMLIGMIVTRLRAMARHESMHAAAQAAMRHKL